MMFRSTRSYAKKILYSFVIIFFSLLPFTPHAFGGNLCNFDYDQDDDIDGLDLYQFILEGNTALLHDFSLEFSSDNCQNDNLTGSHAGLFTTYEGTKTCLQCHEAEALEVHASVHYQWKADASEALGLSTPEAGKLGGINDFCIYPDINWIGKLTTVNGTLVDGGCAKCHVGLGLKPSSSPSQSQLENIDCLICHSKDYKRKVELVNGSYRFVPDTANMNVTLLEAATNITLPSTQTCLKCHAYSGGGNNYKRGDIEAAHSSATRQFDIHMAPKEQGGAGLTCLDCHKVQSHQFAGRGSDLRARELQGRPACTDCHSLTPHNDQKLDFHTQRVDCSVCHIPYFAKLTPTDMDRDWSKPGVLVASKGLYEPYHVEATNVTPVYRFFNGLSHFYEFGTQATAGPDGRVVMSEPDGNITDPSAKLFAFKHHLARQPIDPVTGVLLPLKIGIFFQTGQVAPAVEPGVKAMGWQYNSHEFAETERYMGIFHEVSPKDQALSCQDCHVSAGRVDFASLGYSPKEQRNAKPLCASCHGDKSEKWHGEELFYKVHKKHVDDKRISCSECHNF